MVAHYRYSTKMHDVLVLIRKDGSHTKVTAADLPEGDPNLSC